MGNTFADFHQITGKPANMKNRARRAGAGVYRVVPGTYRVSRRETVKTGHLAENDRRKCAGDSHFRSDCLLGFQEQVYFLKKFETKNQMLAGRSARRRMK